MLVLIHIIVIITSAIICGHVMEKLNQPNIIGELLGGIIVGPVALLLASVVFPQHPFLEYWDPSHIEKQVSILVDIGMVMVMLIAGLGTELEELIKSGKFSATTALGGVVLPFLLGFYTGKLFNYDTLACLFLGASLSITAVAVVAKSLYDLKLLRSRIGTTIMGAAVIDDVIGVLILSILVSIIKHAELPSVLKLVIIIGKSLLFLGISGAVGLKVIPKVINKLHISKEFKLGSILMIVLTYSVLAHIAGLHEIIGAFVAGLILRKTLTDQEIGDLVTWGLGFFGPLFFGWIGFVVRLHPLLNIFCYVIIATACIGKIAGCGIGAYIGGLTKRESFAVGVGMNGRGAVELVLAGVGLEYGVITQDVFSIIVVMAFFTTIITPLGLKVTTSSKR
ncbi:MAG: cation:proton antiporter [Candidatus Methanofastidiosia archaeon]|jgi:Kef-type K+ transport system membrane component KefB